MHHIVHEFAYSFTLLVQVNTLPSNLHPALGLRDFAAIGIYGSSLLFEVIADRQKSAWRHEKENKQHDDKFITTGLWSLSRHPKYCLP